MSEDIFFWSASGDANRRPARPGAPRRTEAVPGEGPPGVRRPAPEEIGRLTLREASEQYGISASTLRAWCRKGTVVATRVAGSAGPRWMVDPVSLERHLVTRGGATGRRAGTGPAPGGGMLVPRDAWDRLMGQLTNLHETGQQLAEARERAARAETEAAFLRERLAELRTERDDRRAADDRSEPREQRDRPGLLRRLLGRRE